MNVQNLPSADREERPYAREPFLKKIIAILTILLLIITAILIYNHFYKDVGSFRERVSDKVSTPNMHNYRRGFHFNDRSMGVYYSIEAVQKYANITWQALVDEQKAYTGRPNDFDTSKYFWAVGFYWMKKKDPRTPGKAIKFDFYIIPTLVNKKDSSKVIDYYNDERHIYYHGKNESKDDKSGFAYDEGQLWP